MKSLLSKGAGLALAALACGRVPQAQSFESAHWKGTSTMLGGKTEVEIWMKGSKTRSRTQAMGIILNVIVKAGDFMYMWQEGQTTGEKMPATGWRGGTLANYVGKIEDVRTKGKKVGTETVEGHPCDIFEYNEPGQERGTSAKETYWLAKDLKNFPVKIVSETGDMKVTKLNHGVELNVSLPDSLLTPPENVTFKDRSGKR